MEPQNEPPSSQDDQTGPPDGRRGGRLFWILVLTVTVAIPILACGGMFYYFRQSVPPLTEDDLAAAMDRWDAVGPASYTMDLTLAGARPGTVHIKVVDDKPVEMTRDDYTPAEHTWDAWTVPGMFETLEQELDIAADPVGRMNAAPGTRVMCRAEFDSTYGYPVRYQRLVLGDGPDIAWKVERFEVGAP